MIRTTLASLCIALGGCSLLSDPLEAKLDYNVLDANLDEARAMALNPDLKWQCSYALKPYNQFGQRMCDGLLKSINGVPASRIDYFFRDGHLSAMIVQVETNSHPQLRAQLEGALGKAPALTTRAGRMAFSPSETVEAWKAKGGNLMTSNDRNVVGNIILVWTADR
jgi:hypothetical protein